MQLISRSESVFAVVLAAALLVFGALAYRALGVSQYPEVK